MDSLEFQKLLCPLKEADDPAIGPILFVVPETVEEVKHLDLLLVSPFELVAELPTIPPAYPVSA